MLRKLMMLVGVMALALMIAAPLALAVNKQCGSKPCYGTDRQDTLYERGGNTVDDRIYGLDRNDTINAQAFTDDADQLNGGRGADVLRAVDGDDDDTLNGGRGNDTCYGDVGDELNCEKENPV